MCQERSGTFWMIPIYIYCININERPETGDDLVAVEDDSEPDEDTKMQQMWGWPLPPSYNAESLAETLSYVKMHHSYLQDYSYLLHTTLFYGGGDFVARL